MNIFPYFVYNVGNKNRLLHGYLAISCYNNYHFILFVFSEIKKNNGSGQNYKKAVNNRIKKKLLCEKLMKNYFNMKYNHKQEKRMKI